MVDRLQCTLVGQPIRLMEPSAAAHAAVTSTTLRARFHTASMWEGHISRYAYDQMDRHQKDTLNEVPGELQHEWDETTANEMVQNIMDVAKHERISIHLTMSSDKTITITPGPSLLDKRSKALASSYSCQRIPCSSGGPGGANQTASVDADMA